MVREDSPNSEQVRIQNCFVRQRREACVTVDQGNVLAEQYWPEPREES